MKLNTHQIVSLIEKVAVIVMITISGKTSIAVIVIVQYILAKVICNCNDYILNVITKSLLHGDV